MHMLYVYQFLLHMLIFLFTFSGHGFILWSYVINSDAPKPADLPLISQDT